MTPRSNRDLHQCVLNELSQDPRLDDDNLRTAVNEGIVTLSGHVPSYAQKIAIDQALHRLSDVRGVANQITVQLPPEHVRTDGNLRQMVAEELRWTVQVPQDPIQIQVENGCVTLEGTVEWDFQRQRAERVLQYLIGVTDIHNLLEVEEHTPPSNLKERVRRVLDRRLNGEGSRIRVCIDAGTVTVEGSVPSWTIRDDVEEHLQSMPGVTDVVNKLNVSQASHA